MKKCLYFDGQDIRLARRALRQARQMIGRLSSPGYSSTQEIPHLDRLYTHIAIDLAHGAHWIWKAGLSSSGRPKLTAESTTTSVSIARVLWLLFVGPLKGGLHPSREMGMNVERLRTRCGEPKCIRPSHMEPVLRLKEWKELLSKPRPNRRKDPSRDTFNGLQIAHVRLWRREMAKIIKVLFNDGKKIREICSLLRVNESFCDHVLRGDVCRDEGPAVLPRRAYGRHQKRKLRDLIELPG